MYESLEPKPLICNLKFLYPQSKSQFRKSTLIFTMSFLWNFCHVDALDQLPLFNMSDKEVPQVSSREVDVNLLECALNNPALMLALLNTFLTHPETAEDATSHCGITIELKLLSHLVFSKCSCFVNISNTWTTHKDLSCGNTWCVIEVGACLFLQLLRNLSNRIYICSMTLSSILNLDL